MWKTLKTRLANWLGYWSARLDPGALVSMRVSIERAILDAVYAEGWKGCVEAIEAVRDRVPEADLANTIDVLKTAPSRCGSPEIQTWAAPPSRKIH